MSLAKTVFCHCSPASDAPLHVQKQKCQDPTVPCSLPQIAAVEKGSWLVKTKKIMMLPGACICTMTSACCMLLWLQDLTQNKLHLTGAHLNGVHLTDVHLTGVNLSGVYLTDVHLTGVNLNGVYLKYIHLTGVHVAGLRIRRAGLTTDFVVGVTAANKPCHKTLDVSQKADSVGAVTAPVSRGDQSKS